MSRAPERPSTSLASSMCKSRGEFLCFKQIGQHCRRTELQAPVWTALSCTARRHANRHVLAGGTPTDSRTQLIAGQRSQQCQRSSSLNVSAIVENLPSSRFTQSGTLQFDLCPSEHTLHNLMEATPVVVGVRPEVLVVALNISIFQTHPPCLHALSVKQCVLCP